MTDGRTYWWAKDCAWWRRERVVELGEEFGPAGPVVLDWLSCEAKAQNDGGRVKSGKRSLARGCFVDLVTVGHVLSRSVTLGLLDDFDDQDGLFTCRISGWQADQERGKAAARKAVQRQRESTESPADRGLFAATTPGQTVTSHVASRPVTVGHAESPTGENRTEEEPPEPPKGGRKRDRDRFEVEMTSWASRHFPEADPHAVRGLVSLLRGRVNGPLTADVMRALAPQYPAYGLIPNATEATA